MFLKNPEKQKKTKQKRRAFRVRMKLRESSSLLTSRLCVHRSLRFMSAQLIDDSKGRTLLALHSKKVSLKGSKTEQARLLGEAFGKMLKEKKIDRIIFDRGPYRYHGRVKAFAQGIREQGIAF